MNISGIFAEHVIYGVLSDTVKNAAKETAKQLRIKPFAAKGGTMYQLTFVYPQKVIHENLTPEKAAERIEALLGGSYRQAVLYTPAGDYQITALGRIKIRKKPPTRSAAAPESHDREKPRLLPEGEPHDFLVRLGVTNAEGMVLAAKRDKFTQINKFLELAADMAPQVSGRPLRVVDFGCGKAYLTFALYYWFTRILGRACEITGLDLKASVVDFCNTVAADLGYTGLRFVTGDIRDWEESGGVDMVVTLHACDTATDYALAKAVGWQAPVILSVPCCQHELFRQLSSDDQRPLLRHGILKERAAALVTDAARAQLLESVGYKVSVVEFVDMAHTPKNLMIRAQLRNGHGIAAAKADAYREYRTFADSWRVTPMLEKLLQPLLPEAPLPAVTQIEKMEAGDE